MSVTVPGFNQATAAPDMTSGNNAAPRFRRTIGKRVSVAGKGVHSGIPALLTLAPAEPGAGYTFQRVDLPGKPVLPVSYENLVLEELERRTTLRANGATVHTIEHVLSALAAAEVDDVNIELDAAEPPFLDGSALPFADMIKDAGVVESTEALSPIVIERPMAFSFGGSEVCVTPYNGFRVSFFFTSAHPNLRSQSHTIDITPDAYYREIAAARTFCFFEEIEQLRRAGLIRGANLSSAVVIGRKGIINDSLRYNDEPTRHKILDFIGDMALLGRPLRGHFMAWRAGHRVNAEFGMFLKKELDL